METVKYDIGSKRKSAALDGVKKSKTFLEGKSAETMAKSCDAASGNGKVCLDLLKQMDAALDPLSGFIKDSQDAFTGSEQERTALDMAYIEQGKVTKLLTQLEEFMVPTSYITPVPDEYNDLPQLKKRATVEMLIKKGEPGAQFDVNGVNYPEARLTMVIDGYTCKCIFSNTSSCLHTTTYFLLSVPLSVSHKQPPLQVATLWIW